MIAQTTFIDPLTGQCIMAGCEYENDNQEHVEYLIRNGLLADDQETTNTKKSTKSKTDGTVEQ